MILYFGCKKSEIKFNVFKYFVISLGRGDALPVRKPEVWYRLAAELTGMCRPCGTGCWDGVLS